MLRRNFITGLVAALAAPAIIRTPGLLMPIKAVDPMWWMSSHVFEGTGKVIMTSTEMQARNRAWYDWRENPDAVLTDIHSVLSGEWANSGVMLPTEVHVPPDLYAALERHRARKLA
jgi:hypothetical protein